MSTTKSGKETPNSPKSAKDAQDELPSASPALNQKENDLELEEENTQISDSRNVRRIIAEDPDYNLATVSELETRALQRIIDNFAFNTSMYNQLNGAHKKRLLQQIGLNIPLKVVADLIEESVYWERKCRARWQLCDISHHDKSWKVLYFERNIQEIIEAFVPDRTDPTALNETLDISAPYVKRLIVTQMLPPIRSEPKLNPKSDDASDEDSDSEEPPKIDHLNLSPIVAKLTNLTELKVTYDVRNIGVNFEWNVFQFTIKDCQNLSEAVANAKQLKVFHLTRSRVDCDRCRVLISKLLQHPNLQELDLSYNHIGDRGTRAIGKLLNQNAPNLQTLRLTTNQIGPAGGQALGFAVSRNTTLLHLDIRMNRIQDEGGQSIAKALMSNKTLQTVNLAANDLSEPTSAVMAQVLRRNSTLISIDLSNNKLGPDGGKQLQEGIQKNRQLLKLDLRFTECEDEALFSITQIIAYNKQLKWYKDEEKDPEIKNASQFIINDLKDAIFVSNNSDKQQVEPANMSEGLENDEKDVHEKLPVVTQTISVTDDDKMEKDTNTAPIESNRPEVTDELNEDYSETVTNGA